MGRRPTERMAPVPGADRVASAGAEPAPGGDVPDESAPIGERHRALIAAHVDTLARLSDLQLEYSRLLNAATRAQQEMERLRAQQEMERLRALEREVADLHLKLEGLWRNGIAQADEARRYASGLESRLDRVNRSIVQRVRRRVTGTVA